MLKYKLKKLPRKKTIVWATIILLFAVSMFSIVRYYASYSDAINSLSAPNTGTNDTTVFINDLEADWNYYMGLNYTEVTDKDILPTHANRYGEDNLVAVKIVYDGTDISHPNDANYRGHVNTDASGEYQYIFEYYKYYVSDGTGTGKYIDIELIDNPYTVRPTDLGFNGWVCNDSKYAQSETNYCNNSVISYDNEYYTRYIRVYVGNKKAITLYMNASWAPADVRGSNVTDFKSKEMVNISKTTRDVYLRYQKYVVTGYHYVFKNGTTYLYATPTQVNQNATMNNNHGGNQIVYRTRDSYYGSWSSSYTIVNTGTACPAYQCSYYDVILVTPGLQTDNPTSYAILENATLININNNNMNTYYDLDPIYSWVEQAAFRIGSRTTPINIANAGAYYFYNENVTGDYDNHGVRCTSGESCHYKLIQYNDSYKDAASTDYVAYNTDPYNTYVEGTTPQPNQTQLLSCYAGNTSNTVDCETDNAGFADRMGSYYYLVTRDINIYTGSVGATNRPFTIEGGTYTGTTVSNDLAIVRSSISYSVNASNQNFKIGRGVTSSLGYLYGGSGTGKNMKVIVESGTYTEIRNINGGSSSTLEAIYVYGSDYDRAKNDNTKMTVTYQINASKAGSATNSDVTPSSKMIVKSGKYGTTVNNNQIPNTGTSGMGNVSGNSYYTYGIYVGALTDGNNTAFRTLTVEGGQILFINGGPCIETNYNGNVIGIYVKGGQIVSIVGGAGASRTYGKRIVSVTGGQVTNQVAGGSNSYYTSGASNPDALYADTLVYVGGSAVIGNGSASMGTTGNSGNSEWFSSTWFEVVPGSVYGAGLGNSDGTDYGVVNNSHVIINGGTIYGDVYGGGNYGTTGLKVSTSAATIDLYAGEIKGSVYGAGNNAGGGQVNNTGGTATRKLAKDYYGLTNARTVSSSGIEVRTHSQTCNSRNGCGANSGTWNNDSYGASQGVTINTYATIPAGYYLADGTYLSSSRQCDTSVPGAQSSGSGNWSDTGSWTFNQNANNGTYPRYTIRTRPQNRNGTVTCTYYSASEIYHTGDNYNENTTYYEMNGNTLVPVTPDLNVTSSNTYTHTITINFNGTTVDGSIYGGSNAAGTVYGNVLVNLYSGTMATCTSTTQTGIYGGGFGANTVVRGNTTIVSSVENDADLAACDIYGGSSQGTVNNYGSTSITIAGGTYRNLYGGGHGINGNTPTGYGNVTVNINKGVLQNAFNGNNILGHPSGTMNITVSGGTIGNVYGGSDGASASAGATSVLIKGGLIGNVYGGGNKAMTTGKANVIVQNGTIGTSSGGDITYGNVYGGGNQAVVASTELQVSGGTMGNAFGGGNEGAVNGATSVLVSGGTFKNTSGGVFGGGNRASVGSTSVNISGGTFDGTCAAGANVFGGGNNVSTTQNGVTTEQNAAGSTMVIITAGANLNNVYGGSNMAGIINETVVNANAGTISCNLYGGGYQAETATTNVNINGTVFGNRVTSNYPSAPYGNAFGGGQSASVTTQSNITLNGSTLNNVYGGSNQLGYVAASNVNIISGTVGDVFGGNNAGGATKNAVVTVDGSVTINDVFGGSNGMGAIIGNYGASTSTAYVYNDHGNTLSAGSTVVNIKNGTINKSVYGGGNQAVVVGPATVNMYGGLVKENVFGGGNEAHIGIATTRFSPIQTSTNVNTGLFDESSPTSSNNVIVNVAGGHVVKNVFGSGNVAFIHGNTQVNIGKKAYDNLGLSGTSYSIQIEGNVFGGSYSNASEDDSYSYSSIGVGGSTNVDIDSTGYYNGNATKITGIKAIYGEGNNSSVTGDADVNIKNFGKAAKPASINLVARSTNVKITDSFIELQGDRDKAQYTDRKKYSFVTIKRLYLLGSDGTKNTGTTLYLAGGGKELENLYSGYFNGNTFIKEQLVKDTMVPNVADNRIYMASGKVLYVSPSDAYITTPGYVNGVAFLGMFNYSGTTINTGIYAPGLSGTVSQSVYQTFSPDSDFTYVYGSSFTRGNGGNPTNTRIYYSLADMCERNTGHQQYQGVCVTHTVDTNAIGEIDGFYSNYVDEDNMTLSTDYVGVTPEGQPYYEWVIGNRSLQIEVYLEASKYSMKAHQDVSIRLEQLSGWSDAIIEIRNVHTGQFGGGNIENYSNPSHNNEPFSTELLPKTQIPVINDDYDPITGVTDANREFGLTMGTTTDGWLNNYSTDLLGGSGSGDQLVGDNMYYYDSTNGIRDLSFWLYSSKNIDLSYMADPEDPEGMKLGVVVVDAFARQLNALSGSDAAFPVSIKIYISLTDGDTDGYGFNIAPGKKYNSFSSRPTTINSDGAFSIYQSLSMDLNSQVSTNDTRTWKSLLYGTGTSYHRSLKSGVKYPAGTRITMLDLITNEQYFYTVTGNEQKDAANNYIYKLDDFVSMSNVSGSIKKFSDDTGSILTGNYVNDSANRKYYNAFTNNNVTTELQTEEFIFTVDFSSVSNVPTPINSYLYMEIDDRNNASNPSVSLATVNPKTAMAYSVVSANDTSIQTTGGFLNNPSNINSTVSQETFFNIYRQSPASLYLNTRLQSSGTVENFTNTIYDDYKLGVNLTFKKVNEDDNGNIIGTTDVGYNVLEGLTVSLGDEVYSPETDGTIRLALAGRISTVSSTLSFDFSKVSENEFEFGKYQVCVDPFGSYDGLYAENGHDDSSVECFNFELLNDSFGIDVTTEPVMVTHDVVNAEDANKSKAITYSVKEVNGIAKPRLAISISRLNDHSGNDYTDISYEQKDICDFVTTISVQNSSVDCSSISGTTINGVLYYDLGSIAKNIQTTYNVVVTLKTPTATDLANPGDSKWKSGTYKVTFTIVDGDSLSGSTIIGSDYEYLIIRKLDVDELIAEGSGG